MRRRSLIKSIRGSCHPKAAPGPGGALPQRSPSALASSWSWQHHACVGPFPVALAVLLRERQTCHLPECLLSAQTLKAGSVLENQRGNQSLRSPDCPEGGSRSLGTPRENLFLHVLNSTVSVHDLPTTATGGHMPLTDASLLSYVPAPCSAPKPQQASPELAGDGFGTQNPPALREQRGGATFPNQCKQLSKWHQGGTDACCFIPRSV